jgi:hypothetical protein
MRLQKRVGFERFLARLLVTQPADWILKGAFVLDVRLGLATRSTKDIDLARAGNEQAATAHLTTAAAVDLKDFFSFDVRPHPLSTQQSGFERSATPSVLSWLDGATSSSPSTSHSTSAWQSRPISWPPPICWLSLRSKRRYFPW